MQNRPGMRELIERYRRQRHRRDEDFYDHPRRPAGYRDPKYNQYVQYHEQYPESYLKLMKTFLNPKIQDQKEKEGIYRALQAEHINLFDSSKKYHCPKCKHFHKPGSGAFRDHLDIAKQKISFLPIHCDPIEKIHNFQIFSSVALDAEELEQIPVGAPLRLEFESGQWSKEEKVNFTLHEHLDKVKWSRYKKVNTYLGPRMVKSAPMTPELWTFWNASKTLLKTAGYSISKYYGWKISHWKQPRNSPENPRSYRATGNRPRIILKKKDSTPTPTTPGSQSQSPQTTNPSLIVERLQKNIEIPISEIQDLKNLSWSEYKAYEPKTGGLFLRKETPIPPIFMKFIRKNKTAMKKFGYIFVANKNTLYHQKAIESLPEIYPELAAHLTTLPWSQPKEVVSKSGKLHHVRETPVDEAFWDMWSEKKAILRRLGYSISQYDKTWKLSQWITPEKPIDETVRTSSIGIYYNQTKLGYVSPTYEDEIKQLVNGTNGKVMCFLQSKQGMMCRLRLVDYGALFEHLTGLIQIQQLADVDIYGPIRSMGSEAIIIEGLFIFLDQNLKLLVDIQKILLKCFKYDKTPPMQLAFRYMHGDQLTQKELAELVSKATYKERQLLESVLPPENEILKKLIYLYQVKTEKGFEILL